MKKILLISGFIILSNSFVFGQSKKTIKNEEIKIKIEWEYIISGNKEKKIKKGVTQYDNRGNIIEVIEYDNYGKFKKRETKKYNENNDVIIRVTYLSGNKVNNRTVYEYKGKFKVLKKEYNGKGKLIAKKEYEYLK